ncbi:MAG: septal ring lytic transglycosylase RlpA family protein [Candidatus Aminicenantales bacterium]
MKNRKTFRIRPPMRWVALALAVVLSAACSGTRFLARSGGQIGIASWYGGDFHGRTTSNREIYNMYEMTAAHPSLPFGTLVLVTNLENGRTAEVRINDRGPFVKDRVIDLSYAAARMLDMVGPGIAPVRLEILNNGARPADVRYLIQVGSFVKERNARELQHRLGRRYGKAIILAKTMAGRTYYRVVLKASDRSATQVLAARLNADGYPVLVSEAS